MYFDPISLYTMGQLCIGMYFRLLLLHEYLHVYAFINLYLFLLFILCQSESPSVFPSSNALADALSGRDSIIGFEDILNGKTKLFLWSFYFICAFMLFVINILMWVYVHVCSLCFVFWEVLIWFGKETNIFAAGVFRVIVQLPSLSEKWTLLCNYERNCYFCILVMNIY